MKIQLTNTFDAFDTLSSENPLPKFTIITGLNGAGKTRLLKGIEHGNVDIIHQDRRRADVRLYEPSTLVPKNEPVNAIPDLSEEKTKVSTFLDGLKAVYFSEFRNSFLGHKIIEKIPEEFSIEDLLALSNKDQLNFQQDWLEGVQSSVYNRIVSEVAAQPRAVQAAVGRNQKKSAAQLANERFQNQIKGLLTEDIIRIKDWLKQDGNSFGVLFNQIAESADKPNVMYVSHEELLDVYPQTLLRDPFHRTFTDWFVKYFIDYRNKAASSKLGDEGALTDKELEEMSRKFPWDISNKLLAAAGLPFVFNEPTVNDYHKFSAKMTDISSGVEVIFSELSSGEKTIISLLTALTYDESAHSVSGMPDVLLLDEPDAHLHPSLTKFLLSSLQDYLVSKLGLSVIMSTHSPITIALAKESSIYKLRKNGNAKYLEKFFQVDAITLLTAGVPTLGVSRLDETPIYTESNYDADVYQKIFNLAKLQELESGRYPKMLSFHASAGNRSDGNRELVEDHIEFLTNHGATNVRGVVDWDKATKAEIPNVIVLAKGKRYSLENAVFDPILLGVYLISHENVEPSKFGLPEGWEIEHIISNTDNAQEFSRLIANFILGKEATPDVECNYNKGLTIKVADEYLKIKGHDLEELIFPKFEELRHLKRPLYKGEIFEHVMCKYPQFIPSEFFELFDALQV